jgi:hypothetical protein
MSHEHNNLQGKLDEATAARLRRLQTLPVDTSQLDAALQARLPKRRRARLRIFGPLTAVAASIALILAIAAAVLIATSGSEVLASPTTMAQLHRDIVSNKLAVTRVNSIDEAGKVLTDQSGSQTPALPDAPQAHVMACCMKSIRNKKMACVLLQSAGTPITMTVARSEDIRTPTSQVVNRNGASYHVQSTDGLHMVMTERDGRWVCLMSELPQDQLIELASRLRF